MSIALAKNILWHSPSDQLRSERQDAIRQAGPIPNKSNDLAVCSFRPQLGLFPGLDRPDKPRGSCKEQLGYLTSPRFSVCWPRVHSPPADLVKNNLLASLPAPAYTYTMEVHCHAYKQG